jgi:predicted enzyme related to lactoylglutathione lyase
VAIISARPNLEVRSVVASMRFYADALCLEAMTTMGGDPPSFAMLGQNGMPLLAVAQTSSPAVAAIAAAYIEVEDVDAAYARCVVAGEPLDGEPVSHPWGMRDFVVRDPDGHKIAVGQRV